MQTELSREQALEFLEGIETRHDEVLEGLEALNLRIEEVLDAYAKGRDMVFVPREPTETKGVESTPISNAQADGPSAEDKSLARHMPRAIMKFPVRGPSSSARIVPLGQSGQVAASLSAVRQRRSHGEGRVRVRGLAEASRASLRVRNLRTRRRV